MTRSALITRFERYMELTSDERDALDWVERRERRVDSGTQLMVQGKSNDQLYIVQQGWLHASTRLHTGARQILDFHYPGDLVGTSGIAWAQASVTLTAVSDCVVAELSKANLGRIFRLQPRLAALLYAMAAAESSTVREITASTGSVARMRSTPPSLSASGR